MSDVCIYALCRYAMNAKEKLGNIYSARSRRVVDGQVCLDVVVGIHRHQGSDRRSPLAVVRTWRAIKVAYSGGGAVFVDVQLCNKCGCISRVVVDLGADRHLIDAIGGSDVPGQTNIDWSRGRVDRCALKSTLRWDIIRGNRLRGCGPVSLTRIAGDGRNLRVRVAVGRRKGGR